MEQTEIETRIRSVLSRFAALEMDTLELLVLRERGEYSYANEEQLRDTCQRLTAEGILLSAGRFGPFRLAPSKPSQPAGRSTGRFKPAGRPRSSGA